jgi:monofunctional biosynthetic peptidoglycan transglycosylase
LKQRKTARPPARRRWILWIGTGLLALALVPVIQVALVRFFDPPLTPLMLLRPIEARWEGRASPGRHYTWLPLAQMPPAFVKFILVAEDQRFFQHRGFDWREVKIARQQAGRSGKSVRGASTVTMQCARSLFLWQGRSWVRKGLEAYYTFWMETLLPKRRILELYANVIEMGEGIYGVEAAARAHFDMRARALDREQCLALAALLPAPRQWNPREPSPKFLARCAKIRAQEKQVTFPQLAAR